MADAPNTGPSTAQQPGLRSFIVYRQLPKGCLAFEAPDHSGDPHICQTEFAVIDPNDRDLMSGEMYLMRFDSGREAIVEIRAAEMKASSGEAFVGWTAYWSKVLVTACGTAQKTMRWSDGAYREAGIAPKLVGKVVGILEPDFRLMLGGAA